MVLNFKENYKYLMECVIKEIQSLKKDLTSDTELINLGLIDSPDIDTKSVVEIFKLSEEIFQKIKNFRSEFKTNAAKIEKKITNQQQITINNTMRNKMVNNNLFLKTLYAVVGIFYFFLYLHESNGGINSFLFYLGNFQIFCLQMEF